MRPDDRRTIVAPRQALAVRFTKAVEAYGVNLTSRTGYSNQVTLEFKWAGPRGKKHYICGEDGKSSAYVSGRVFTGSRK